MMDELGSLYNESNGPYALRFERFFNYNREDIFLRENVIF